MADKELTTNRKAHFDYFVIDSFETGIVLSGDEVKSIRDGKVNIGDSFCFIKNGELWVRNSSIIAYEKASSFIVSEERRDRKLLMHAREISKLSGKINEKGLSLIPLKMYLKGSLIKMLIGLCQGKKQFDKRQTVKDRDAKRSADRAIKELR